MSLADELLATMSEEVPVHKHAVTDPDSYFIIDPDTREITNSSHDEITVMQFDHNSEIFTFEVPRYIEGHDMLLCNRVRVHFNNIDGTTNEERQDVAEMYDLAISPENPDKLISTWCIRREATQLAGTINFLVQYECIDANGESTYEWHTDIFTDVYVKAGRNFAEQAVIEYSNVLEQWYQKLFGAGDSVVADIAAEGEKQVDAVTAEGATQKEAIVLKGEETLATIPADYTTTYNMAEEALRKKANAIVLEAESESIVVNDSSDAYLLGLKLFGKTTQKTTTGAQLIPQPYADGKTAINGVRFIVNADGSVAASGTSTAGINYYFARGMTLPAGTYTFSMTGDFIGGRLYIYDFTDLVLLATLTEDVKSTTFTTDVEYANIGIYINTDYEGKVFGGMVYPMLNAGSTVLPYEQYTGAVASPNPDYPQDLISASNPKVIICGKNIWNPKNEPDVSGTYWGWKVKHSNEKMTITLIDKDTSVDLAGCYFGVTGTGAEPTTGYRWLVSKGTVYLSTHTTEYNYISVYPNTADTLDKLARRFYIMVELGEEFISYEDPRDGMTLSLARDLNGIPITDSNNPNNLDGNYTDVNGQQWICDEIDFERGVYIQRVYTKVFDGIDGENIALYAERENVYGFVLRFVDVTIQKLAHPAFCTHFKNIVSGISSANKECFLCGAGSSCIYVLIDKTRLSEYSVAAFKNWLAENPITILFQLIEPVETPLTEEEIAYYKKLKTNYHNTTVMNDRSAHTAIKYAADTLIYLRDNQPKPTDAQVEAAINEYAVQNGVQVPSDDHIRAIVDEVLGGIVNDEY